MAKRLSVLEAQKLWLDYRGGDIYALGKIMDSLYTDLFNWGMRLYPEKDFIKDMIQDMFLGLWKIKDTVSVVDNVQAYLLVMLKRKIFQEVTARDSKSPLPISDDYEFLVEFSSDLRLIEEEHEIYQMRKIERLLNDLPSRQKELIYLRFYQNLNFEEIAETMQLGRQSVYNLFQKSLKSLRKNWIYGILLLLILQ
jgi:RNA polymerase sigma factor (sigma-70 family)